MVATPLTKSEYYDLKTNRLVKDITKIFKLQAPPYDNCYPNGIHNILCDLSLRHSKPELNISEKKVNRLCGYKAGQSSPYAGIVSKISKTLEPFNYTSNELSTQKYKTLLNILSDVNCSYPLISLSWKYIDENIHSYKIEYPDIKQDYWDHTVILLYGDEKNMVIYDPLEGRSQASKGIPTPLGRGIVSMSTPRILNYWQIAQNTSWFFWINKHKSSSKKSEKYKKPINTNLEPYM